MKDRQVPLYWAVLAFVAALLLGTVGGGGYQTKALRKDIRDKQRVLDSAMVEVAKSQAALIAQHEAYQEALGAAKPIDLTPIYDELEKERRRIRGADLDELGRIWSGELAGH